MQRLSTAFIALVLSAPVLAAQSPPPPAAAPAPAPAPAAPKTGELLDKVVAIVNDGIVTESELDEQIEQISQRLREQNTALPPAAVLRKQVLDRLIVQEV